jgi:DnaJ-class molecular chaperone
MLPIKTCENCVGSGIDIEHLVDSKTMSIIDCKECNGTGYRTWIDEIKRPSKKSDSGVSKSE